MPKKFGKNIIFFLVLFVLTFFFLFKGQNLEETIKVLLKVAPVMVLLGILLRFIYMLAEAVNLKILFSEFGINVKLKNMLEYALIGFFYASITPSATGGQPMQVYYMKKDGIDYYHSTITFLITASTFYISILTLMILGAVVNYSYLKTNMSYFSILMFIGIGIIFTMLMLILSLLFSKKAPNVIMRIVKYLLNTFKVKNRESLIKRLEQEIENYKSCSDFIKKNKRIYFIVLGITFIQELAHYSINYVTMRTLGINGPSLFRMISLQGVLFASISMVPLPGSMGANEMGYKVIYTPILGEKYVSSAAILTRFMEFYFYVCLGGVLAVRKHLKVNEKNDKNGKN